MKQPNWDVSSAAVRVAVGFYEFYTSESQSADNWYWQNFCKQMSYSHISIIRNLTTSHIEQHMQIIREMAAITYGRQRGVLRRHLRVVKALAAYWEEQVA